MAVRQRRLDIVIAWMQLNPGVVAKVQSKLNSLAGTYGFLRKNVGQLNLTADEHAVYMKQLTSVYQEMRVRAGANRQSVNMLNKALKATTAEMEKAAAPAEKTRKRVMNLGESYRFLLNNVSKMGLTADEQTKFADNLTKVFNEMRTATQMGTMTASMYNKALKMTTGQLGKAAAAGGIFNKIFTRMGYRTSWVGFRMAIMGRLIMRAILAPMQRMVGALTNWEKSMETVALALALQEAGMGETGLTAEELRKILLGLAETGMTVQTAMWGIGATWDALALENAPTLISILGEMQDALEGVGGEIISSMVDAVGEAVPVLGDFLDLLDPISSELGTFAGYLLLAGVAMTGIGTAIYLAKPALYALQLMLNPIVIMLAGAIVLVLLWKKYWGDWAAYMENVVFPVFEKLGRLLPFWEPLKMFGKGVGGLAELAGIGKGIRLEIPEPGLFGHAIEQLLKQQGLAQQEVDIDVSIDIENMLADVDVDAMVTKITDEIAEALRQRGYP